MKFVRTLPPAFTIVLARVTASLMFALGFQSMAYAQNDDTHSKPLHQVHFSISQAQQLDNDVAEIRFHHIAQAPSAEGVMQEINQHMQAALKVLETQPDIKLQTSPYQVYPAYNKQQIITHWKGRQSLILTTEKLAGLPKLLTQLQPYLSYESTQFRISEETRQKALVSLTQQALQRYQKQAELIAQSFGNPHYQLVKTQIHSPSSIHPPRPYLQAARTMSEAAAPVIESGQSELRIQIDGTLQLGSPSP